MTTGRDFTGDQWDEIYAARARLESYKLKVQPYPAEPEEEKPRLPEPEWTAQQWALVQQLQSEVRGWRTKYNETLNELEKLKPKKEPDF